ncbi:choice-of-anchor D domain-containing protein [Dasania marina]|uniref:choice-of-anchor D domain-containing protein n=1 Tax=Dasania marina TaxID=471499 RepID=UPI00036DF882|nr:choice-of-anchor D domain-containing protein [Dasania marina]
MINKKYLTAMGALLWGCLLPVQADTIFSEDFQDGEYSNWSISGDGYDAANYYAGNYSMRTDGLRQGVIAVSTEGYESVSLSMDLAALYLVYYDFCYAEYSTNSGTSWNILHWITDGGDDGSFDTTSVSTGLDDNPNVQLRLRAYTWYGNYCYGDNITLTGTPISGGSGPEIDVAGSGSFGAVVVDGNATNTLTITNNGDSNLNIGSLTGLASPFSVVSDTCSSSTVTAGNNCTVGIKFEPTTESVFSDTLSIASNDSDENPYTVNVSGTGVPDNGGGGSIYDPFTGDGNVSRSNLGYSFMTGSGTLNLMNYSNYAVPANAANPSNTFEGKLTLSGEYTYGSATEVGGDNNLQYYPDAEHLPEFEFEFVQHGTHFIPVTRGLYEDEHTSWAYILEPGRVWNEDSDNGYSRVSFPFSLQERNNDCIWNGVMTFLFKDDGSVSNVSYQIASETCLYMKVNFWGKLSASYSDYSVTGASTIKSNYEDEVARRMPVKPISALATDYPGNGVVTSNIGSDITAADMTIYGVAYNGVHYSGGCSTRYGDYPFCEVMNVPSYSTAKSVNGAYGLMRLEQKYAGTQRTLGIDDYVSECYGSQWASTTFENAMDMATGNYTSSTSHADEASQTKLDDFFFKTTHADKASFACAYPYKTTPGNTFVYHTSDTYLLGRAMNVYYQGIAGSGADFFSDVVVDEIYKPLGLSPTTYTSLRTQDAASQAHTGFGLVYVRDDVVKLGEFLNKAEGKIDGIQTLDSTMVNATLNLGSGGLSAGSSADKYNNGFWYYDIDQATHDYGCSGAKWVPYMAGFGGISVVLFPNDMVFYHFSDNDEIAWGNTAIELDKISALCP